MDLQPISSSNSAQRSEAPSSNDALGLWFSLLESTQGECMDIRFARAAADGGDAAWTTLPHRDYDGIGGLRELQRRCYGELSAALPTLRSPWPGWPRRALLLARFLTRRKIPVAAWRALDPAWSPPAPAAPPEILRWRVLSADDTAALRARARAHGASLNGLLLWALGRAVEPALDLASGAVRWMVPVNLRGPIVRPCPSANHASYVCARTPPGGTVAQVEADLREALARHDHVAAWDASVLCARLGERRLAALIAADAQTPAPWVGVFSNLGVVADPPGADQGRDDAWLFCPPVTRRQPLCTGALTFRGRLALTLQVHPALRVTAAEAQRWLDAWIDGARRG